MAWIPLSRRAVFMVSENVTRFLWCCFPWSIAAGAEYVEPASTGRKLRAMDGRLQTGRLNGAFFRKDKGCPWQGPEILAINLIAENQPFDFAWHEEFRCNRRRPLLADYTHISSYRNRPARLRAAVPLVRHPSSKTDKGYAQRGHGCWILGLCPCRSPFCAPFEPMAS